MPELNGLDWSAVGDRMVVDCWRCLAVDHTAKIQNYRPLGQGFARDGETLLEKIRPAHLRLLTE
jgi:hypothetical protein